MIIDTHGSAPNVDTKTVFLQMIFMNLRKILEIVRKGREKRLWQNTK